jgi:GH15 family glucan-1,4-alpha-glucosidase
MRRTAAGFWRRLVRCVTISLVGFLPSSDEQVTGTIDEISGDLSRDGFVSRYSTADTNVGLSGDEARALFERLIGLSNDLGRLAEEYDVRRRRQVGIGNFPQAFRHLTLIGAAAAIAAAKAEEVAA